MADLMEQIRGFYLRGEKRALHPDTDEREVILYLLDYIEIREARMTEREKAAENAGLREKLAASEEARRLAEETAENVCAEAGRQGREHAKIIDHLQAVVAQHKVMTAWQHIRAAVRKLMG